jgi:hypothetical protein
MINVGVDVTNFRPIDSETIDDPIGEGPVERSVLPTSIVRPTTPSG